MASLDPLSAAPAAGSTGSCYDPGVLRAYLDEELPATTSALVGAHVGWCHDCQELIAELRAVDEQVASSFPSVPSVSPASDAAWARLRSRLLGAGAAERRPGRPVAHLPRRRALTIGAAAAALLLAVLLVPPVQAALLQIFRAQSVVYVSVSPERIQQLENLHVDQGALFLTQPALVGSAPTVASAASPQQAGTLAGFAVQSPSRFPSAPTGHSIEVRGQSVYQLQVSVQTVRATLAALGVTDVSIPDSLGAQPITIQVPPMVQQRYQGSGYTLALIEGISPTVNLPKDVNLAQLGKAALEVYGLTPQQADTLAKQIDWNSTLVFPFPLGTSRIQQVDVGGAQGVLLDTAGGSLGINGVQQSGSAQQGGTNGAQPAPASNAWSWVLYWQRGSRFYILEGRGSALGNTSLTDVAASLR
jgi:hypothetical protein